jgi:D-arginine dehydrogenase
MDCDVAVIGGGIAGLSAAAWLAPRCSVVVIEAEDTLGYHATGRSAAAYTECYGSEMIRRLAKASFHYLVSEDGLTSPQPVLFVAAPDRRHRLDAVYDRYSPLVPDLERLSPSEVSTACSALGSESTAGGVREPGALNLDVHALLTGYITTVKRSGGQILTGFKPHSIERTGRRWRIASADADVTGTIVVNAAGAWGDEVAAMAGVEPLGLCPLLRSVFTFTTDHDTSDWPLVVEADVDWYFKPEGPNVLGSAASELSSPATDVRAPELDIALGIEKLNTATDFGIRSVRNTWAGLRTFTADGTPAVGFDDAVRGFFWLVGQGGYGIKTSPALGQLAAALILTGSVPESVSAFGVTSESLAPDRFRQ